MEWPQVRAVVAKHTVFRGSQQHAAGGEGKNRPEFARAAGSGQNAAEASAVERQRAFAFGGDPEFLARRQCG